MPERKDSKNVRDEERILALYSEALLSGKTPSIDEYVKDFKGNKESLAELLSLIKLLHETFKSISIANT